MKRSIKLYFLIFLFFIFSTYNTKYTKDSFSIFFPIKIISIENNFATNLSELKSDLNFLKNTSLLFLNKEIFLTIINKHNFISNIQLKKKYPNTLKVIITEKVPVATQIIDRDKFYITKENEKIRFIDLAIYKNLPSIFGKYKSFNIIYNNLKKNNFKINEIKAFYYFDVGRWDIALKNEKIIKLPERNYLELLPKINLMLNNNDFSKYKVFDFRIKNQLILK
jgi:cell division septal protein FtsQ